MTQAERRVQQPIQLARWKALQRPPSSMSKQAAAEQLLTEVIAEEEKAAASESRAAKAMAWAMQTSSAGQDDHGVKRDWGGKSGRGSNQERKRRAQQSEAALKENKRWACKKVQQDARAAHDVAQAALEAAHDVAAIAAPATDSDSDSDDDECDGSPVHHGGDDDECDGSPVQRTEGIPDDRYNTLEQGSDPESDAEIVSYDEDAVAQQLLVAEAASPLRAEALRAEVANAGAPADGGGGWANLHGPYSKEETARGDAWTAARPPGYHDDVQGGGWKQHVPPAPELTAAAAAAAGPSAAPEQPHRLDRAAAAAAAAPSAVNARGLSSLTKAQLIAKLLVISELFGGK